MPNTNRLSSKSLALFLPLLAVLAGVALWLRNRPSAAQEAYDKSLKLMDAKQFNDAKTLLDEAVKANPNFAPPYRKLAELASKTQRPDIAINYWEEYLKREPNAVHARCKLASVYLATNQETTALKEAEAEIKQDANCSTAHLIAGILYAKQSVPKLALDHLAIASKAFPDQVRVQLAYGKVLALTGNYDRANEILQGVITKDKSHAEPFYWLGYVQLRRPQTPETQKQGETVLRQALQLQPDFAPANYELANLLFQQGKANEALPFAESAIKTNKLYASAILLKSQIQKKLGKTAEAQQTQQLFAKIDAWKAQEKSLLRQFSKDRKDLKTILALGNLEFDMEKYSSAYIFIQEAYRLAPNDPEVKKLYERGRPYYEKMNAVSATSPLPQQP